MAPAQAPPEKNAGAEPPAEAVQLYPPPPQFKAPGDAASYTQALTSLLATIGAPANRAADAPKHFDAARKIVPDDPRPPFAYGLTFLGKSRYDDAITQFKAARQQTLFLPAWQMLIRTHVMRQTPASFDLAFAEMLAMGKAIEEHRGAWPDQTAKTEGARWLGRMTGYLKGPCPKAASLTGDVDDFEKQLLPLLNVTHRTAYEAGLQMTAQQQQEILNPGQPEADAERAAAKEAELSKVENEKDSTQDERKKLEATAEQLNEQFEKAVTEIGRQLAEKEVAYRKVEGQGRALAGQIQSLDSKIRSLMRDISDEEKEKKPDKKKISKLKGQLGDSRNQRQSKQAALDGFERQAAGILAEANVLRERERSIRAQFKAKMTSMNREGNRLEGAVKQLDKKSIRIEETGGSGALKVQSQAKSLNSYLPLDLQAEGERIVQSLKP
jgi:hypothetical protein